MMMLMMMMMMTMMMKMILVIWNRSTRFLITRKNKMKWSKSRSLEGTILTLPQTCQINPIGREMLCPGQEVEPIDLIRRLLMQENKDWNLFKWQVSMVFWEGYWTMGIIKMMMMSIMCLDSQAIIINVDTIKDRTYFICTLY